MGTIITIVVIAAVIYVSYIAIKWAKETQENTEQLKILEERKQENERDMNEFMEKFKFESASIVDTDMIINLKCPIKKYRAHDKSEYTFGKDIIQVIQCYIGLTEDYLYIVPKNIRENECTYTYPDNYYTIYNIIDDYKRLVPNYKGLFFKINVNDIKFYKQKGIAYAKTSGNIGSEYSYGSLLLTGDSEYRTKGEIRTKLEDNREIEFYYDEKGSIKQLVFDYEALTTLQLLIPDKEKK